MELGRLGVWCATDGLSSAQVAHLARTVEALGYGALWQPESFGRDVTVLSSWLLANTSSLIVASGIASIYARDAQSARAVQQGLAEQSDGRFLLGLGVSHAPAVERMRGHAYGKPIAAMRAYLEAMARSLYMAPPPAATPPLVIAALGPRMLELAAEMTDGAHTYNVTPEHTADARQRLGPDKLLCVEQMVVLETDVAKARATARATLGMYLNLPNYRANWQRLGFSDADLDDGGSDRLIDATVAWGDLDALRDRVRSHWQAGADHVCIQPLSNAGFGTFDDAALGQLAPNGWQEP
ncbi:TIGR03620 family F420-dependent LLM class oxidoreductase [Novosphingobium sp. JCM 18896]|uniref:TIGR03620 family F420-dependent LLM class oxidoreductase n=1 Tax=Novosphingobium sp. JCM 18896 TaxID=2989731 RepID=UPI0022222AA5|nr:TIGR03620 family F420-dependent LLM class oxidoreductase [Novosphingobium sp. JCM 18896]MCW1431697.1 TIGR03620 family F420-dependent LLM class oxidoreductase [Novosphingobium sp. JCM 18896]